MEKEPEKVSVIIPLYNREEFIEQTVQSVLEQTFSDLKLYVVDDGSTDNSRKKIEEIKDDRIVILEHPGRINKGQAASINVGLDNAEGEYIAILDSDDFWEKRKLEIQIEFLEKHKDIGLVYCNGVQVNEYGEFICNIYKKGHVENNNPEKVLLNCYFLLPNNSLVRSSCFNEAGRFNENLRAAQDHDMAIRISEITNIAYIDKFVFSYRRHQASISHKNAEIRWKNGFVILDNACKRYNYSNQVVRKRRAVLNFRLGQCAMEKRQYMLSIKYFTLSGLCDPVRAFLVMVRHEKISSPH